MTSNIALRLRKVLRKNEFYLKNNMILLAHKLPLWLYITDIQKQMLLEQIKPSNQTLSSKDTSFFHDSPLHYLCGNAECFYLFLPGLCKKALPLFKCLMRQTGRKRRKRETDKETETEKSHHRNKWVWVWMNIFGNTCNYRRGNAH